MIENTLKNLNKMFKPIEKDFFMRFYLQNNESLYYTVFYSIYNISRKKESIIN